MYFSTKNWRNLEKICLNKALASFSRRGYTTQFCHIVLLRLFLDWFYWKQTNKRIRPALAMRQEKNPLYYFDRRVEKERGRECVRERESERDRVCVSVCVWEREREEGKYCFVATVIIMHTLSRLLYPLLLLLLTVTCESAKFSHSNHKKDEEERGLDCLMALLIFFSPTRF